MCASTPLMKMGTGTQPSCMEEEISFLNITTHLKFLIITRSLNHVHSQDMPSKMHAGDSGTRAHIHASPPSFTHLLHAADQLRDVGLLRDHMLAVQQHTHARSVGAS